MLCKPCAIDPSLKVKHRLKEKHAENTSTLSPQDPRRVAGERPRITRCIGHLLKPTFSRRRTGPSSDGKSSWRRASMSLCEISKFCSFCRPAKQGTFVSLQPGNGSKRRRQRCCGAHERSYHLHPGRNPTGTWRSDTLVDIIYSSFWLSSEPSLRVEALSSMRAHQ